MSPDRWQVVSLETREDSDIGEFLERNENAFDFIRIKTPSMLKEDTARDYPAQSYCNDKREIRRDIERALRRFHNKRIMAAMGEGGFHHLTYGLCGVVDSKTNGYGYLHIDGHNDYGKFDPDKICCTSFVSSIERKRKVKGIRFFGETCPRKDGLDFNEISPRRVIQVLQGLPEDVYVSCDLDILSPVEFRAASTPQGNLTVRKLLNLVDMIRKERNIISADVLGYFNSGYSDEGLKELLVYRIVIGRILGEDTREFESDYRKAAAGKLRLKDYFGH